MNVFWWGYVGGSGKGIIWKNWQYLCSPKKYGSLGFRRIRDVNLAMLAKQAWRFLLQPNTLVAQVFNARYYPNSSFSEAVIGNNLSFIRWSILQSQVIIKDGISWRVGNGTSINVWDNP